MFSVGFAILIIVRGVVELCKLMVPSPESRKPSHGRRVAVTVILLLIGLSAPGIRHAYGPKQDYAGARDLVRTDWTAGDAVAVAGVASVPFRLYYAPEWPSISSLQELDRLRARSRRTWLVFTLRSELAEAAPGVLATVERDFRMVRAFDGTLRGGTVFVYRADLADGTDRPGQDPGD
jgi:hypothetical protein